jgi:hypothetical protein
MTPSLAEAMAVPIARRHVSARDKRACRLPFSAKD